MTNSQISGDRLQRFSRRSTHTYKSSLWKSHLHSIRGVRGGARNGTPRFMEDDVTWVASNLSGTAGALGAETVELRNWILRFGCVSEDPRVVVARLADWMANFSPPGATYLTLMKFCLLALDKRPGVRPVGIGEKLRRDLAKLVMIAAGGQAKTVCDNLQLCEGLQVGIEDTTHLVGKRRL